ncbi:hypothetical protein ACFQZT_12780 [Paenibacillus sp. GCM10027628]|uniref:hypothetical protein n=1 Tax=Paenibacillus sp. GCM10027628 TaxID=3273413 RepID=UPI00362EF042
MRRFLIVISFIIFMFLSFVGYEHLDIMGSKGGNVLNKQINKMISNHDLQKFKEVAKDNETYDFLIKLPNITRCEKTSDAQGGDQTTSYFVTVLNHRKVEVWMKRSHGFWLGNQYTLDKVKVTDLNVE